MSVTRLRTCRLCGGSLLRPSSKGKGVSGHGRGLCSPCYCKERRANRIHLYPRSIRTADEVLDAWGLLLRRVRGAWTLAELAKEIGMKPDALDQALTRARRRGDPRAVDHRQFIHH